ncbi:MAG TPA: TROVE domain-containing protein [Candidatus Dormibacteraeota bacterium]|jgi:60 kDa SS-A/Ro ribonucleoprotein|nr:TROVE domain-containing protein [Candidatus Dormibacteraeota bacterium]
MRRYLRHLGSTPQSLPIPEAPQMVPNRAGGYVYPLSDEERLWRFLVLGSAEGSYYASAPELTRENALVVDRLLEAGKGPWVVDQIVQVSESGRAPRQEPAILALALCLRTAPDLETRRKAAEATPRVCRTLTALTSLAEATRAVGARPGWGRVSRRAFNGWLTSKTAADLAYQAVKYRQRQGWTLADVVRRSRPLLSPDDERRPVIDWVLNRRAQDRPRSPRHGRATANLPAMVEAFERLQAETDPARAARLVRDHRLPWEAVPDRFARDLAVQEALFASMPTTAMIRQLGRLTNLGLIAPGGEHAHEVVRRLEDGERLRRARVHPFALFLAHATYAAGAGLRGHLSWKPVPEVAEALEAAFFASFGNLRPSGRRILTAVDFSGSMGGPPILELPNLSPALAGTVMAAITLRTEPGAVALAFDTRVMDLHLDRETSIAGLAEAAKRMHARLGGGTDCAAPILHAIQGWSDLDGIVLYTDEETWAGSVHPIEAISRYRARWERPTRLVTVAMVAHGYTLTNRTPEGRPEDAGAMTVVGMDPNVPTLIGEFLARAPVAAV